MDRSPGQVAFEKWAELFWGSSPGNIRWSDLQAPMREAWEAIAGAVLDQCGSK